MNPLLRIVFRPLTGLLSALLITAIEVAKVKFPEYSSAIDAAVPYAQEVLQALGLAIVLKSAPLAR